MSLILLDLPFLISLVEILCTWTNPWDPGPYERVEKENAVQSVKGAAIPSRNQQPEMRRQQTGRHTV